jgi:hypothetical protein
MKIPNLKLNDEYCEGWNDCLKEIERIRELHEYESFESYLEEIFMKDYSGTDDDLDDNLDNWLEGLDSEEVIELGNSYADYLLTNN